MIEFQCDYAEGAHPKILERMIETNMDQTPGYGLDPYCDEARRLIRKACGRENIDDAVSGWRHTDQYDHYLFGSSAISGSFDSCQRSYQCA